MTGLGVLVLVALPLILRLPIEADLHTTLPPDVRRALDQRDRFFGRTDLVFLLVEAQVSARSDLIAFGTALSQQLASSDLIRRVEFGYAPALWQALQDVTLDYAPMFVPPERLAWFDQLLTPEGIETQLRKTWLELSAIGGGARDRLLLADPLQLRRLAYAHVAAWRGSFRFDATSPYFLSPDGQALLIRVEGQVPVDDMAGAKATVQLLQRTAAALLARPAFQGLAVHGTGGYFLAAESEQVIRRDIIRSLTLSVLLICGLMVWTFRRWRAIVYGQLPTLMGLFLALGFFALLRPELNALSLGCAAALTGLGIDFAIHILTPYFDHIGRGEDTREAVQRSVRETGGGLLAAGATTMAAFAAFQWSDQAVLRDMGLLAVCGIFFCLALSLILLPALMACFPLRGTPRRPRTLGVPQLVAFVLQRPGLVLGLSLLLSLGAISVIVWRPPGFETDLRRIHAADSAALQTQERLSATFGGSQEPLMLLLEAATEADVLQAMQRLQPSLNAMIREDLLAAVTSLSALLPDFSAQDQVLQRLRQKDPDLLAQALTTGLERAGVDVSAYRDYIARVGAALARRQRLDLQALRDRGLGDLLRSFLGSDGSRAVGLVILFPKQELWTAGRREALWHRMDSVLASLQLRGTLTDLYSVSSQSASRIGADFLRLTLLAAAAIGLVVCLRFRHPRTIAWVLLPVLCGTLWTVGLFSLCGLKVNFMNIAIVPMILGIGIDDGIHIVHRLRRQGAQDVQAVIQLTGTAVCLSSLTTISAFGTLALSTNQGIASVGLLTLVGVTACLLASLCTLPAALHWWEAKENRQRTR
jgi:hypothetical protein